jgi:ankyrin repeat protein
MRSPVFFVFALFAVACAQDSPDGPQDILEAVGQGDEAATRRILDADPRAVGATNEYRTTPLHLAVAEHEEPLVRLLLEHGADPDLKDHGGHTPLHIAAMYGHDDLMDPLLESDPEIDLRDDYGRTPLLLVARESGSLEAARALLEHGADVNALDRFGAHSLNLAAWRAFEDVVDLLLDYGSELDPGGRGLGVLTEYAAQGALERLFGELFAAGADLGGRTSNGGSLLHAAAEGGSRAIVGSLLDRGFDPMEVDRYGWTPLHYAAERGREEVSAVLLDRGADADAVSLGGHTPLSVTETYGQADEARLLTVRGASLGQVNVLNAGGPFMGQELPGPEPVVFAPDIVSSNRFEHGTVTFSPDGTEAFWQSSFMPNETGYSQGRILTSRLQDGRWTPPEIASFSPSWRTADDVPFLHPDGSALYFDSSRPDVGEDGEFRERLWVVRKTAEGWGEPELIRGGPNTMGLHWQFSVAANGTIYFGSGDPGGHGGGDVWVSRYVDGAYQDPENLGPSINTEADENSPFIAPDESYIIFTGMGWPDAVGGTDLYISFKTPEGEWTPAVNMGETVNSPYYDMCPMVSGDGRFLFFNSRPHGNADNYWMDAGIIQELRRQVLDGES